MDSGHAVEDGTLPLLSCMCNPDANSGDFYGPYTTEEGAFMFDGEPMVGPPKKLDAPEPLSKDPESHKVMWEASEAAVGQPFFT